MTKREAEIIIGLAQCNLNIVKTAERLQYPRNTLHNHLKKIKRETGFNPKYFRDMCRLFSMAEEVLQIESEGLLDLELVIRCRDCEFWLEEFGDVCSREEDWFYMAPDDFCSRAVMRK